MNPMDAMSAVFGAESSAEAGLEYYAPPVGLRVVSVSDV